MKFEKLNEEGKAKAIKLCQEIEQDIGEKFLQDSLLKRLAGLLEKNGMTIENQYILYSLSHSHGDGFIFSGDINWKGNLYKVRESGYYYNSSNCKIICMPGFTDKTVKPLIAKFNKVYVKICKDVEAFGYEHIENALSEDVIRKNIIANELEFEIKKPEVLYLE